VATEQEKPVLTTEKTEAQLLAAEDEARRVMAEKLARADEARKKWEKLTREAKIKAADAVAKKRGEDLAIASAHSASVGEEALL
jgi:hypothetical protein